MAAPSLASQIPEAARVRLGRVIRNITNQELRYGDGSGESTAAAAFDALADQLDPDHAAAMDDAARLLAAENVAKASSCDRYAKGGRRPRQGSPVTDHQLGEVAQLYRAAIAQGVPPTQTIADEMHAARSTAARWVGKARERGFLGAALPGRAGEADAGAGSGAPTTKPEADRSDA